MADNKYITLEQKIGFDRVRKSVCDHCQSSYAANLAAEEEISTDPHQIRNRLLLVDESVDHVFILQS